MRKDAVFDTAFRSVLSFFLLMILVFTFWLVLPNQLINQSLNLATNTAKNFTQELLLESDYKNISSLFKIGVFFFEFILSAAVTVFIAFFSKISTSRLFYGVVIYFLVLMNILLFRKNNTYGK